jgi:hypothetical protein
VAVIAAEVQAGLPVRRERGILFSAPMVRALLAGAKTQTRRIIREQDLVEPDIDDEARALFVHHRNCPSYCDYACGGFEVGPAGFAEQSPIGGHTLWVREAFAWSASQHRDVVYRATDEWTDDDSLSGIRPCRWRPGIHLPRVAARILLEITELRVQRLQAIDDADAKAEGAAWRLGPGGDLAGAFEGIAGEIGYRNHFADLWRDINGEASWDENPWVWAITFRVTKVLTIAEIRASIAAGAKAGA